MAEPAKNGNRRRIGDTEVPETREDARSRKPNPHRQEYAYYIGQELLGLRLEGIVRDNPWTKKVKWLVKFIRCGHYALFASCVIRRYENAELTPMCNECGNWEGVVNVKRTTINRDAIERKHPVERAAVAMGNIDSKVPWARGG